MPESAAHISAAEAERCVLILEKPGLKGRPQIANSLCPGLQLMMPGAVAPAHPPAPSALRFIVEGSAPFTAVDGQRTLMQPGDFIITPGRRCAGALPQRPAAGWLPPSRPELTRLNDPCSRTG